MVVLVALVAISQKVAPGQKTLPLLLTTRHLIILIIVVVVVVKIVIDVIIFSIFSMVVSFQDHV